MNCRMFSSSITREGAKAPPTYKTESGRQAMTLMEYIEKHYNGSTRPPLPELKAQPSQHVQKWVNNGWLVMGSQLVSPKKDLVNPAEK